MLLRLTINGWRKSFAYYADEIEAAKAYKGQIAVRSICEKSVIECRFFAVFQKEELLWHFTFGSSGLSNFCRDGFGFFGDGL